MGDRVAAGEKAQGWARLLSRLAPGRVAEDVEAPPLALHPPVPAQILPTKALRKFIACLQARPAPAVLDVGPGVGANVSFFGEQLGCKVYVEDLFADLERHAREGRLGEFAAFLAGRFRQADESVDGILCWDLLDYIPRTAAASLAAELTRVLSVDGALLGFFSTAGLDVPFYTKYVIVDETNLQHLPYSGSLVRKGALANRDIIKLFEALRVSDSFLLQAHCREILFRKPSYLTRSRVP